MTNAALKHVVEGTKSQSPSTSYQNWNVPGRPSGPGQPGGQYGQPGTQYGQPGAQYGQPGMQMPGQPGYQPQYQPAPPQQKTSAAGYMTMDDVVVKTAISALTVVAAAIATWVLFGPSGPNDQAGTSAILGIAIGGAIIGFVLALVNSFKRTPSAPMVLLYCVAEGAFLGGISGVFEMYYPGIVIQAVIATAGVFLGMLIVYRTGAIRVTPKFQRWLTAAVIGAVVLMLFNLGYYLFTGEMSMLRNGGPLAIGFSLLMIGIAAFTFLSDFDMADQAIRRGAPKNFAWGIAFGLIVSIVWLYIEILRLLTYLRN